MSRRQSTATQSFKRSIKWLFWKPHGDPSISQGYMKKKSIWRRVIARFSCKTSQNDQGPQVGHSAKHEDDSRQRDRCPQEPVPECSNNLEDQGNVSSPNKVRRCSTFQGVIAWHEQPEDDESMVRLLEDVVGRLTDHTLNFYITQEGGVYDNDDKAHKYSDSVRDSLDDCVINWESLIQDQEGSWVFVLNALFSKKILTKAIRAVRTSTLPASRGTTNWGDVAGEIAQNTCQEMAEFAPRDTSDGGTRLSSMKKVVGSAITLAFAMENQPVRVELLWAPLMATVDYNLMHCLYSKQERALNSTSKVGATVFPGLRKFSETQDTVLLKAKVILD